MVFSFFKKQPQKMPERPAARPRAPVPLPEPASQAALPEKVEPLSQPLPDLEFTTGHLPPPVTNRAPPFPLIPPQPVQPSAPEPEFTVEDFDREFTDSSVMAINVENGDDPVQSDIEHVVVLFANGQDTAVRSLLEMLVRKEACSGSQRFWLLLFDFLQAVGDRTAFDKLGAEFAEICETSPPTWRQAALADSPVGDQGFFVLQGVLTAEGAQPVAELAALLGQKQALTVDCGKLLGCDDDVAGQLAELLQRARHAGPSVVLENVGGVLKRLDERLLTGDASHARSWDLLLELLQRHGTQEAFEERAVEYAVTFERSPPSWEPLSAPLKAMALRPAARDDAYYLSGQLKNHRFEELVAVCEARVQPILDFSDVSRIDFFSAGQLVNRLAPFKSAGSDIVIRNPNRLVAELMAVVGLTKLARIIVPKS